MKKKVKLGDIEYNITIDETSSPKKVWIFIPSGCNEHDDDYAISSFSSLEVAIDSVTTSLKKKYDTVKIEKVSDSDYRVVAKNHYVDFYHIIKIPVYESIGDYLDAVADRNIKKMVDAIQIRSWG